MTPDDFSLIVWALASVVLAVVLITRFGLHPFLGLLTAAITFALIRGLGAEGTITAVEKGFGSIMSGAGLVVALGMTLGAMLHLSGAASVIAAATIGAASARLRPWSCLAAAMVIGLPLFFETGVVLLLPIIAAAAAAEGGSADHQHRLRLGLMLPALCGLSVLHALLPPHPGPMIAVQELRADVGLTMLYGMLVAIPTAIIAGPVFAHYGKRWAAPAPMFDDVVAVTHKPPLAVSLLIVLLPVVLIAASALATVLKLPANITEALKFIGDPVAALLATNLIALVLLFAPRAQRISLDLVWRTAMSPAGSILLSIGAGGALKQVLVDAGMAATLSRLALAGSVSATIMGWGIAVLIRLATGSATVATITASGVMAGVITPGVGAEWVVLAIGAGSVFFSHVNDPGFWLVRGYLGVSTTDNFKTWSVLETLISVVGLAVVLMLSQIF